MALINDISDFDEDSSSIVESRYLNKVDEAVTKIKDIMFKVPKHLTNKLEEVLNLLEIDYCNDVYVPINDWKDLINNVDRIIPKNASLEEADKFKEILKSIEG